MKNQTVYAIIDDVAKSVCHVFFANTQGFAERVFQDFFKRAEVPEDKKKDFFLLRSTEGFVLPETYSEFMEKMSEGRDFQGKLVVDLEKV